MLPLARYRLHWRTLTPTSLPDYAGSTLRGAFGHALRRIGCLSRNEERCTCPPEAHCAYSAIFAPHPRENSAYRLSQPPVPYLIEPPPWGARQLAVEDDWHFDIVLCGRALAELPLITLAFRQALERGIGPGDGRSQLIALNQRRADGTELPIYRPEEGRIQPHDAETPQPPEIAACHELSLHFHTPLRLQENGRALPPNRMEAVTLLMAAVRRASLMGEFHGHGTPDWDFSELKRQAQSVRSEKNLQWQDWTRRSARQQQSMQLGGAVGTWTLQGEFTPFLPALHLCQWLHLGKETVFGLGGYTLEHKSEETRKICEHPLQATERKGEKEVPR